MKKRRKETVRLTGEIGVESKWRKLKETSGETEVHFLLSKMAFPAPKRNLSFSWVQVE